MIGEPDWDDCAIRWLHGCKDPDSVVLIDRDLFQL